MARLGLGANWTTLFANDNDPVKVATYAAHFGSRPCDRDVESLSIDDLTGVADLAWASFPCQDLSLAGPRNGLGGERSGTFWPFWHLIEGLAAADRAPKLVVLENVVGALTSHGGEDFAAVARALVGAGYRFGPLIIDAARYVPQSRPRLFIIGVREELTVPLHLVQSMPDSDRHPRRVVDAREGLCGDIREAWNWWALPQPRQHRLALEDLIEDRPNGVDWDAAEKTFYLLSLMTDRNLDKVQGAKEAGRRVVGTIYRRTRPDLNGKRRQRAEVRFDGLAGCLRTPVGGSSRQTVITVEGDRVRTRLLAPREAARLMGLPDWYQLPKPRNAAYHLLGDGVVVPVVRHIAEHLLEPILSGAGSDTSADSSGLSG